MAEKHSVLKVDIDDAAFQRFKKQFSTFSEDLKSTNSEWSKLKSAMNTTFGTSFAGAKQGGIASEIPGYSIVRLGMAMERLGEKIAGLTLTIGRGALGIATGGAFGLGAIGYSAFDRYRTATGLGITPGALSAFSAYYSPFVSGKDVLSRVAQARNDLSLRPYLARMGIGQDQLQNESNDQIAADITQRAAKMWRNGPQTTQFAEAMGLTQFFTLEDLRRLGATSDDQLAVTRQRMIGAEDSLNFSPQTAQAWTDLTVQLRKAGVEIDTVLIKDLQKLATPLGHLSDAIVKTLDSLLSNPQMGKWIDDLGHGIEWLGAELISPEFRQGIRDFFTNVENASIAVGKFLHAIGMTPDTHPLNTVEDIGKVEEKIAKPSMFYALQALGHDMRTGYEENNKIYPEHVKRVMELEKKYNLPAGSLFGIWGQESSFSRDTRESSAGAVGPFQLMPSIYRAANINPNDFDDAAEISAKMYAAYLKKYHDPEKALAARDWGPANLDADIAAYGSDWKKHLPNETQGYIPRVQGYQAQEGNSLNKPPSSPKVNLSVTNSTSARMAVTAATLAH